MMSNDWLNLKKEARAKKRGLWADPNPLPPWEFRARKTTPETDPDSSRTTQYWLNPKSNVSHNERCENFSEDQEGPILRS
jgi:micrococcal nuclease